MSEKFRNSVFVLCVLGTIATMVLNLNVCKEVRTTLNTTCNEAVQVRQIAIAQEHAMQLVEIANRESSRVAELEDAGYKLAIEHMEAIRKLNKINFQLEFLTMSISAQGEYITHLCRFIEENNLSIPELDVNRVIDLPSSGYSEDGNLIDPLEVAPIIDE